MNRAAFVVTQTEAAFQKQVTDAASLLGWSWMHIVRAPTNRKDSWRTPAIGPLGQGWPDLVLVRHGTIIFAELKSEKGTLSAAQETVLALLGETEHRDIGRLFNVRTYVWRPSDWEQVMEVLSNA